MRPTSIVFKEIANDSQSLQPISNSIREYFTMSEAKNLERFYKSLVDRRNAAQILEKDPTNPRALELLARSRIERPKSRKAVNEDLKAKIGELEELDANSARGSGLDSETGPSSEITSIETGQRSGQSPEPSISSHNTLKRKIQDLDESSAQGSGHNKKAGASIANTSIETGQESVQSPEPSTASQNTQG